MIDSFKHKGLRKILADTIKEKGILNALVLKAIETVPRHFFLDSSFIEFAYEDRAFPIGFGQTISQPYTVAYQTQLLEVEKGDKVLEVGTGSGYQACVLLEIGAKVYTIERQKSLYTRTKAFLPTIGYKPKVFYGDGYKGLPAYAPFDKIIVTAGAPFIPEDLLKQLVIGGKLVIPVGSGDIQIMKSIIRTGTDEYEKKDHGTFRFVPLLKDRTIEENLL
jgi:protein-L-isoaspartate(D-aspartate) O-methyltransferase